RFTSVYIGLDHLILTDAFADFVRTLTLRGAQARFSIRDLDRVLRRYDQGSASGFSAETRRTPAGLERLLYITPFDFRDIVEAVRQDDNRQIFDLSTRLIHDWLRRDHTEQEVLGAEPLERILKAYVLERRMGEAHTAEDVPFQAFLDG